MRSLLLAVTFEADNPAVPARFWAGLLGREVIEDTGGVLLPGEDAQLSLRFVPGRAGQLGANRMHLHLTSADLDGGTRWPRRSGSAAATSTSGSDPMRRTLSWPTQQATNSA